MKEKCKKAFMETAEIFAKLSTANNLKVGAVAVKDNRILSIGYNGMPSGWTNICEWQCEDAMGYDTGKTKPEVLHAEANCIAKLARSNESSEDATLFVTHSPCIECAKLIHMSGFKAVFYKHKYRKSDGLEFLKKCNIKVEQLL